MAFQDDPGICETCRAGLSSGKRFVTPFVEVAGDPEDETDGLDTCMVCLLPLGKKDVEAEEEGA